MPRPYEDSHGNIVHPKDLRRLWVVRFTPTFDLLLAAEQYLTRDGRWSSDVRQAAAWHEHEKALAEEVAASVILANAKEYLGRVFVVRVLG